MDPDLERYIEEHIDAEPAVLHRIERDANVRLINGRMCSGHLQGRTLKMLVSMISPKNILELGTFAGYSAICIAEALEPGARLHTVECDDELEELILRNFEEAGVADRITLHIADACDVLDHWEDGPLDLIFIDADKRHYSDYYRKALPLLRDGGYIIADNTLWYGHVIESDHARDAQTAGIRDFNDLVAADENVEKVILPLRDGLTLIRKKPTGARNC